MIEVVGIGGEERGVLYKAFGPSGDRCGVTGVEAGIAILESFARKRTGGLLPFSGRELFDGLNALPLGFGSRESLAPFSFDELSLSSM